MGILWKLVFGGVVFVESLADYISGNEEGWFFVNLCIFLAIIGCAMYASYCTPILCCLRLRTREEYSISEVKHEKILDCVSSCCFPCCSLFQLSNELDFGEHYDLGCPTNPE